MNMSGMQVEKIGHQFQEVQVSEQCELSGQIKQRKLGNWSSEEQEKYIVFLQVFRKEIQSNKIRRFSKIFKLMAYFVKNRDGIQCRSHHMKQLRTHRKFKNIIERHRQRFPTCEETQKLRKACKQKVSAHIISKNKEDDPIFKQESQINIHPQQQDHQQIEMEVHQEPNFQPYQPHQFPITTEVYPVIYWCPFPSNTMIIY